MSLPPTQSMPVPVPAGARCAIHADRPAELSCARCGNFACAECKRPAEEGQWFCAACDDHAAGHIPLEQRAELGLPRAFGQTLLGVLLRPWVFFAQRPREHSLLPPFLFATAITAPASLLGGVVNALTAGSQLDELRNNPMLRDTPGFDLSFFEAFYSPVGQIAIAFLNLLVYPLYYVIGAGLQWVVHWAVGARGATFREVLRATMYLQGTNVALFVLLPMIGVLNLVEPRLAGIVMMPYVLWTWVWLVIAMWKVQRTELWRPVAAQGLLLMVCCCIPMVLAMVAGFAVAMSVASSLN